MKLTKLFTQFLFGGVLCLAVAGVNADLVLTSPPRESVEEGKKLYEPLAKLMSKVLNQKVVYEHPQGWMQYSSNMRDGKYDIIFDGPHFAAWRIKHLKHMPIARLPGTLDFVVVAKRDNKRMKRKSSIARGTLCAIPSPHLATVSILSEYQDSVVSPKIIEIKGGPKKVWASFKQGKCDAAVLRLELWKKIKTADKQNVKVLYTTPSLPNQTITVSPRVDTNMQDKLANSLRSKNGESSGKALLSRFSKNAKYFVAAKQTEYTDLEQFLEGIVFGW